MITSKVQKIIVSALLALLVVIAVFCGTLTQAAGAADYRNWKQSDAGWASLRLGSSGETVKQSGCAVTAAAILMVHSGSVTNKSFTPATIINYLNKNGGFSSNGVLQWWVIEKYAPEFRYVDTVKLPSSQAAKTAKIRELLDEGYYLIASVKNGAHFVAIDSVSGSRVNMMDPGSYSTSLFDEYAVSGVDSLRVFKGANSGKAKTTEATQKLTDPPAPVLPNPPAPAVTDPTAPSVIAPPAPETTAPTDPTAPTVPTELPELTNPPAPTELPELANPPAPTELPELANPPAPTDLPALANPPIPEQTPSVPELPTELPAPPMPV